VFYPPPSLTRCNFICLLKLSCRVQRFEHRGHWNDGPDFCFEAGAVELDAVVPVRSVESDIAGAMSIFPREDWVFSFPET
jgi:hypothetical protein